MYQIPGSDGKSTLAALTTISRELGINSGYTGNIANSVLVGFDTETTAPDPEIARIVQAAIVVDIPGNSEPIVFDWLIDPGIEIPLEATAVHGINTETAKEKGMSSIQAIPEILSTFNSVAECFGPIPLIIYNAVYDLTTLDRDMRRNDLNPLNVESQIIHPVIDPMVADRQLDKWRRGRRTLTATSAAYRIAIRGAHQASGDVICSIKLARAIASKFPKFGRADLELLQKLQMQAHREWCEHFMEYRRMDDEEFCISTSWPIIEFGAENV